MTLKLYYHPLASYCWKALIALYEAAIPFEPVFVDLSQERDRAELAAMWPFTKFPVLRDEASGEVWPEASIVIEVLAQRHPAARALVPTADDDALKTRLRDRFFDLYVHESVQKIVGDRLRPPGGGDAIGVEAARRTLATAYSMLEEQMSRGPWAMGETFTLADCAAAPALFYANEVQPLGGAYPNTTAYLERLKARPSVARVLKEAGPYFAMFPR